MAKKRSCRRTDEESQIHEQAVKIRKMTDSQLVEYISRCREKAREEGFRNGQEEAGKAVIQEKSALDFITFLQTKKIPGIGIVKINTILEVARQNGFIENAAR